MNKNLNKKNSAKKGQFYSFVKINTLLLCFIFVFGFTGVVGAVARFQPGETLNPDCLPTDSDCAVVPPSTSTDGGTILYNTPIYSSGVTWQHPRDPGEITGNTSYTLSVHTKYGMYELIPSDISVSAIKANVWNKNTTRDVTFKIFARSSTMPFDPDSVAPLYSGIINHTVMPHASTPEGFTFNLTSPVNVSAGQYLYVFWESELKNELVAGIYNIDSSSAPFRHRFVLGVANANFAQSSLPTYSSATFRVYGSTDITRSMVSTLGTEILTNTGFENLGGTSLFLGWSNDIGDGTTGKVDETTIVHSGSHAFKITSGATSSFAPQLNQTISVSPGQEYQLSFWTRGDGVNSGKYAIYDLTNGTYLNNTASGATTGVSGSTYTQVTTTFTAPLGCNSIKLFLISANVAGAVAYFDDISIKSISSVITQIPVSVQTVLNSLSTPTSLNVSFSDPNSVMTSTNARDAILEAYNHGTGPAPTLSTAVPRIVLPDNLYAVVGDKLQLFVRGIIEAQNPYNLPYVINSTVGNSYPRYFEYTPVALDVGTKSLSVKILNYDYSVLNTKTVNLNVSNPTGQPASPKNILTLGDSLTAPGTWSAELYRRLTQTGGTPAGLGYGNINFIGDKALPGYPTQAYTGYGGWTYGQYNGTSATTYGHVLTGSFDKDKSDVNSVWQASNGSTWNIGYTRGGLKIYGSGVLPPSGTLTHVSGATHTSNIVYSSATTEPETPFWDSANNRLSFSAWASRNNYSSIDAVYVLLGWNDVFSPNKTDFTSLVSNAKTFLNQFHADFPNAIVRIVGIEVPSVNGGLGANYGSSESAEFYGMVRTANSLNMEYQNLANDPAYSSWVKFISIAPQFDSENNMPQSLTPVNSRNSATEYRGTNGVHPSTSGSYQIADAVYREFVNTFTSN